MLSTLLLILKILLWILLGILALALILILLVLFVPIKYKIDAQMYGKAKVCAKVSFLMVSVRILFDQEKNVLDNIIRVFGIRLNIGKDKPEKVKKPKRQKESRKKKQKDDEIKAREDEHVFEDIDYNDAQDNEVYETDNLSNEEFDLWDNDNVDIPEKEEKLSGRIVAFFKNLFLKLHDIYVKLGEYTPDKIIDKIEQKTANVRRKVKRFKRFWNLSCTIKTRSYLIKYVKSVFKHIMPRKVKGHIRYGFGDPAKTGQITGYISMLPFVYHKKLFLEPDFENKITEGHISLKGHIRLGYIARIALNINIWKTAIKLKKVLA